MRRKWLALLVTAMVTTTTIAPCVYAEEQENFEIETDQIDSENSSEEIADIEEEIDVENDFTQDADSDVVDDAHEIDEESESSDIEQFITEEDETALDEVTDIEDGDTLATVTEANSAPYSSVDKLENGSYTVTANVYVPGELNKVLVGTNAFLTNPKYPFGSGADKGKPTTAMTYNAELTVNDDDITVTLELKNPVFQAIQINDGSNVTVVNKTYNEELSNSEIHTKYGNKIQTLTLKLKDFSGLYEFGDCKEFASILYTEGNESTEADAVWDVPLKLAVDFQGIGKQETTVVTSFLDPELQVALVTNKELPEGTTEDFREITADSEGEDGRIYQEFAAYLKNNETNTDNRGFRAFYIGLKDADGNPLSNIEQYKPTFYTQAGSFFAGSDAQMGQAMARIENGELTTNIVHGTVGDAENDLAVYETENGVWDYTFSYEKESFSGGYIFIYDKNAYLPFTYHTEDTTTGIGMNYCGVSDAGTDLSQEEESNTYYRLKTAKNKRGYGDSDLETELKEKSGYNKLVYDTYQLGMYSIVYDPETTDIMCLDSYNSPKLEAELPVSELTDFQIYKIIYDKSDSSYSEVEQITDYTVENGKAIFTIVDYNDMSSQKVRTAQRLYGAVTDDENYYGKRSKNTIQYYAIVSEGAVAEKPSVSDTTFTYDGTDKILIQESKYYTVSGDATAKLPGSYKATVTLNDGYAWKDGTTDSIEFTWTIEALKAEKPSAVKNLVYNRDIQVGVKEGEGYTLTNNTAKKAGTYHATAILNEGYVWSDGSSAPVTVDWSIAKYNSKITLKASSKTYKVTDVAKKSASFSIGATGVGTITYKVSKTPSGASKCISVDKNGKVIVAKNAKVGTYTVRVNASGDNNNNSATRDVTIKVFKLSQNVSVKTSYRSFWITAVSKKAQTVNIGGSGKGKITYKVTSTPSGCAKSIKVDKNGKVTVAKSAKIGDYVIRVTASGDSTYNSAYKDVKIRVVKATQKISAKVTSKTYKASDLKKKSASFTIGAKGQGKLTYKVTKTPSGASKCISVNSKGKVTVAKNAKVGTYTVRVTAAGNGNYNSATKDITIKVTK